MKPAVLAMLLAGVLGTVSILPARAQWTVYDPTNYAQNVLQAARALEQVNNQIRALQNQATMLENMARNLRHLDYSSIGQITGALNRIDGLMIQADAIGFDLTATDTAWQRQYPESYQAASDDALVQVARDRWQSTRAAYQQTMRVQAGIVGAVQADGPLLTELVGRSQGAEGALQAQQATNQLLALSTKQQMQIQSLMAAQYRAEAENQARQAEADELARERTRRFLGAGTAYTPY